MEVAVAEPWVEEVEEVRQGLTQNQYFAQRNVIVAIDCCDLMVLTFVVT